MIAQFLNFRFPVMQPRNEVEIHDSKIGSPPSLLGRFGSESSYVDTRHYSAKSLSFEFLISDHMTQMRSELKKMNYYDAFCYQTYRRVVIPRSISSLFACSCPKDLFAEPSYGHLPRDFCWPICSRVPFFQLWFLYFSTLFSSLNRCNVSVFISQ